MVLAQGDLGDALLGKATLNGNVVKACILVAEAQTTATADATDCLLYTSPSPRDS